MNRSLLPLVAIWRVDLRVARRVRIFVQLRHCGQPDHSGGRGIAYNSDFV